MADRDTLPNPQQIPGVVELAGLLAPDAIVTETSHPPPALDRWNVAVLLDDATVAREAVLALEAISADDAAVGFTVLSPPNAAAATTEARADAVVEPSGPSGVDREGVIGELAPRAFVGGLIGALVGAAVIGLAGWFVAEGVGAIAGAIGGALFGAPIGAIWGGFTRMGGSDAYRQTFVDPDDPSTFMVSLHTADPERADRAASCLGDHGAVVRAEFDGNHLTL